MTVDPRAGIPLRIQLAGLLRQKIRTGELSPGQPTPSGPALADEYKVSRYTADRALDMLAAEGLVQRVSGIGTIITATGPAEEIVDAPPGAEIRARMPSAAERASAGLPPGVPVLELGIPGQPPGVHAADRTVIRVPAPRLGG